MVHGQATTQKERELITARLFRRDAPKDIARDMNVSERSIRRMSKSLREHGTPIPPREPKPRGRHQLLSGEEHDVGTSLTVVLLPNNLAHLFRDSPSLLSSTQ